MACNLYFIFFMVLLARSYGTQYEDCGSADEVLYYKITDCEVPPCIVVRPGSYTVDIAFIAASNSITLNTTISAKIGGIDYPWPAPNACKMLINGTACPIVTGTTYYYSTEMPVYSMYPAVTALVTWKLTDEHGIDHVCTVVPITLI